METNIVDIRNGNLEPGYVYDIDEDAPINFPDVNKLLADIILILEYMNIPEIKLLKSKDNNKYKMKMETKFPDFSMRYMSIFDKIISGDDISMLLEMLSQIELVKSGSKNIESAEKFIGERLANKFVFKSK